MPTRGITTFGRAHPPPPHKEARRGEGGGLSCSDAPGGHQACGPLRKVSGRETQCPHSFRMIYPRSYAIPRLVSATIKSTTPSMRPFLVSGLLPAVRVDPP